MPSNDRNAVEFQVHFRGVAVYVANAKPGYVTEVLFPKADEEPTSATDEEDDKTNPLKKMKHADDTDAIPHFAGALIVRNGKEEHRDLSGRNVQLSTSTGTGAEMSSDFLDLVPPLDEIITDTKPNKRLKLLKKTEDPKRIATRFVIDGSDEDTATVQSLAGGGWQFLEANGTTPTPVDYGLEVVWTISADAPLTFDITDLKTGKADVPIVIDDPATELYFYNFDVKNPSKKKLLEVKDAVLRTIDHDFKWTYKLFQHGAGSWKKWLDGSRFPAPELVEAPTVSVSTCFELVWTGESET